MKNFVVEKSDLIWSGQLELKNFNIVENVSEPKIESVPVFKQTESAILFVFTNIKR